MLSIAPCRLGPDKRSREEGPESEVRDEVVISWVTSGGDAAGIVVGSVSEGTTSGTIDSDAIPEVAESADTGVGVGFG